MYNINELIYKLVNEPNPVKQAHIKAIIDKYTRVLMKQRSK